LPPLQTLGFLLGASFASGLNLYATVAALGLLHRFEAIRLPAQLEVLANPLVLGIAITLYAIEFIADKIPYVDNVWDVIHTFIRPPAAGVLAYAALGGVADEWRLAAALLAGSVALTSHSTKASTRAAANTSPEPVSNWLLSLGEDGIALFLVWLAATHPILALVLVLALLAVCIYVIVTLFRFLRRIFRRVLGREPQAAPQSTPIARG
jgi:ABC-type xylose transport system permease subunit